MSKISNNITTKPDYKEFTDSKMASMYDVYNQHYTLEKKFYFEFASEVKAKKIIDLGCGTGLLTIPLAEHGYEMVGVEPANAMLEIAKQNPKSNIVKWIHGDALDLSESNVDLTIMTSHVVQFLLEDTYFLDCLRSINKCLKSGSYLVFDSRNTFASIDDLGWPTKDEPKEKFDSINGKMHWWVSILEVNGNKILYEIHTLIIKTQQSLISVNELIFRTKEEIISFLSKSNFMVEKVYGDWDKQEVQKSSSELIFIAKKIEIEDFHYTQIDFNSLRLRT